MKQAPIDPRRRVHRADQFVVLDEYRAAQAEEAARADRALRRFSWESARDTIRSGDRPDQQEAARG